MSYLAPKVQSLEDAADPLTLIQGSFQTAVSVTLVVKHHLHLSFHAFKGRGSKQQDTMGLAKAAIKIVIIPIIIVIVLAVLAVVMIKIKRSKRKDIEQAEFPPPAALPPPVYAAASQPQMNHFTPDKGAGNHGFG
ncbi:hypothetical protein ED733_008260 [Metarhizium rileyi]|uniref:Uncharacterized protein n=1 Tax=Metarhizium rileyi (strain RCEF 4871) TaxID=1649241 RepID=A0A5C6GK45_METRR|nr:hypothetical protein ED733_008260 [Metarhizium rileyi]